MAEHGGEIAAIAAIPNPADFANTIEALERSGRTLTRIGRVFDNLTSSATNPALDAIDRDYAPRLAALHTLFGQNVLHDEDEWRLVLDEADLDGLPEFARAAASAAAAERGLAGKYVITLARASVEPFLSFSAHRDLRRTAYEAW